MVLDRFAPTANLTDFDGVPGLRQAWSSRVSRSFDGSINQAVREILDGGGSREDLRFYHPRRVDQPANSTVATVTWPGFPQTLLRQTNDDRDLALQLAESPRRLGNVTTRLQDEYLEWFTEKQGNQILRVTFSCEPPEYYDILANPPASVDRNASRNLLLKLYQTFVDPSVQLSDLFVGNAYNPFNIWNRERGIMHLHHPANTLGAQINIAARASVLRVSGGQLITDADALIRCAGFGDGDRASDPKIGISVNGLVQQGRQVTLENPVGLYMQGINTAGFSTPDGSDPQKCWRVIRGQTNASVRAVFEPPVGSNFTLDQIEIGGEPLRFGGQLAEKITMFLNALQGPVQSIGAPDPITCPGESDLLIAMPLQR